MFSFDQFDQFDQQPGRELCSGGDAMSFAQMGQPAERVFQRQQTDNLPAYHGDSHGVERELQFADLEYRELQAMG